MPNAPAVVSLHALGWWPAKPRGTADPAATPAAFYRTGEDDLALIAQYYDVPALSVRCGTAWIGKGWRGLPCAAELPAGGMQR